MDYSDTKDELLSIVDSGIKYATKLDSLAEIEIYIYYKNFSQADIEEGVVLTKDGEVTGNAVRASKGKRVSFASASGISSERIRVSIQEALSIVDKVKVEDDKFNGFADPSPPGREGAISDDILNLTIDDLLKSCEEIVKEAKATDTRIKTASSQALSEWGGYAIGNTRGIQAATRFGCNRYGVYVISVDAEERRVGLVYDGARDKIYDTEGLGKEAAEQAISLLGAKKLGSTEKLPTIWTPRAVASFMYSGIGQAVNGRWIVEQKSPLCDRIGDTLSSNDLNLADDGQDPLGFGTYAIDSEGKAQQKNILIDKGVLKTFLFDSYYGNVADVESTGSCFRGGGIFGGPPPYETAPRVSTKWLTVEPGNKTLDDLIGAIDGKGILILDYPIGIFHSQVSTGDFSVVANSVYLIENGEKKYPIQPVPIGGNFYEGLKNLLAVGNDVRFIPDLFAAVPSLVFDGFSVVGE